MSVWNADLISLMGYGFCLLRVSVGERGKGWFISVFIWFIYGIIDTMRLSLITHSAAADVFKLRSEVVLRIGSSLLSLKGNCLGHSAKLVTLICHPGFFTFTKSDIFIVHSMETICPNHLVQDVTIVLYIPE